MAEFFASGLYPDSAELRMVAAAIYQALNEPPTIVLAGD